MKNASAIVLAALGLVMMSTSAFAPPQISVPEPMSMSLVFGGVAIVAAVRKIRRK